MKRSTIVSADLFERDRDSVATFSPCRTYRYSLWRRWGAGSYVMFIGLNPSTADEVNDDPTIRRCIRFAKDWGHSGLCMTNLFAFRATDPRDMKAASDPVGARNDQTLLSIARNASVVVAAWGAHGGHLKRSAQVESLIGSLHALKLTQDGSPSHTLYLPSSFRPERLDELRDAQRKSA
jgi:hypothetical protein